MKAASKKMAVKDKICYIAFDEMDLKPHTGYSRKKDMVTGFEDYESKRREVFAGHASVFMVRGVHRRWNQPIGFYRTDTGMSSPEISVTIKAAIRSMKDAGFRVVATVCDQGSCNGPAYNALKAETKAKYIRRGKECRTLGFEIDDEEIIPLFDSPHLIKCFRNNFLEKDVTFTVNDVQKRASWSHIVTAYKLGLLPSHITELYVEADKISKMRVKYAVGIFSNRCAKALRDGVKASKYFSEI